MEPDVDLLHVSTGTYLQKDPFASVCWPCPSRTGPLGAVGIEQCGHNCPWPLVPTDGVCQECHGNRIPDNSRSPPLSCQSCQRGKIAINGTCVTCDGANDDRPGCQCEDGQFVSIPSPHCEACGPKGERLVDKACVPCKPGTYSQPSPTSGCEICGTGTFTNAPGQSTCSSCRPACPLDTILNISCSRMQNQQCHGCRWPSFTLVVSVMRL
jgi:hypothetical protein